MSAINTGYCEIIATGDCDFLGNEAKTDRELAHIIASEVVGEIVETAMEIVSQKPSSTYIGDISPEYESIVDGMEKIKINDEEDIKKLPIQGVGDQLETTKDEILEEKKSKHPPVEKKSRLTDLVKNSKQLLSKYILNDNIRHDNPADDNKEKVVQVIELDQIQEEDIPQECPENVQDLFSVDDEMDDIHLEKEGTGDTPDKIKKTMTFPIAGSSSSKTFNMSSKYRTLKMTASELKKKKWNIGAKFMNYIKKHKGKKEEEPKCEQE